MVFCLFREKHFFYEFFSGKIYYIYSTGAFRFETFERDPWKAGEWKMVKRIKDFFKELVSDRRYPLTVFFGCLILYLFSISGTVPLMITMNEVIKTAVFSPVGFTIVLLLIYLIISGTLYYLQIKQKNKMRDGIFLVSVVGLIVVKRMFLQKSDWMAADFISETRDVLFLQGVLYLLFQIKLEGKRKARRH